MAGIEEQLQQMIHDEVRRVAALESQDRRPWVGVNEVKELVGMKENQTVINNFCISKKGKPTEANRLGLTAKIAGRWRFKMPEFKQYCHDEFWDKQR